MSEKRKKTATICLKTEANDTTKLELFRASDWCGPQGSHRLRVNGRWLDGTHEEKRFFTSEQVGALVASWLSGAGFCLENEANSQQQNASELRPNNEAMPTGFMRGLRISVPNPGKYSFSREVTRICSEHPFQGVNGGWYISCYIPNRGTVMVPVEAVIVKDRIPEECAP